MAGGNCMQNCCHFCYDKENKTFCNRPCKRWYKSFLYYGVCIGLVLLILFILLEKFNLDYLQGTGQPHIKKKYFVEHFGPGTAFVAAGVAFQIIAYQPDKPMKAFEGERYVKQINSYFRAQNILCGKLGMQCRLNTSEFGPCKNSPYGFDTAAPCLFLKLNKVPDWLPRPYSSLKEVPNFIPKKFRKDMLQPLPPVAVICKGASPYDEEIIGDVTYYPGPFFAKKYFPLPGSDVTNPLIAIRLNNIKSYVRECANNYESRGHISTLECKCYAKNIDQDAKTVTVYVLQDLSSNILL